VLLAEASGASSADAIMFAMQAGYHELSVSCDLEDNRPVDESIRRNNRLCFTSASNITFSSKAHHADGLMVAHTCSAMHPRQMQPYYSEYKYYQLLVVLEILARKVNLFFFSRVNKWNIWLSQLAETFDMSSKLVVLVLVSAAPDAVSTWCLLLVT
jgi:hypothetical protein